MSHQFRDLEEEVYDSTDLEPDDKCSLLDEGYWYDNDLLLAAELGKTLLERNRDLETQLVQQQKYSHDQEIEIDLLIKQLSTLRDLSESKMRMYEDVDRHNQDLESLTKRLEAESSLDKQKIHDLSRAKSLLEVQIEEIKEQIRILEQEREEWLKARHRELDANLASPRGKSDIWGRHNHRRSNSMGNIMIEGATGLVLKYPGACGDRAEYGYQSPQPSSVRLRVTELTNKLKCESNRANELEDDLALAVTENRRLKRQLQDTEKRLMQIEEEEYVKRCTVETSSNGGSNDDGKLFVQTTLTDSLDNQQTEDQVRRDLFSKVEHDHLPGPTSPNPSALGRLHDGGHIFSSQESLNRVGATPLPPVNKNMSLLAELDQQYNKLVTEYEAIVSAKKEQSTNLPRSSTLVSIANTTGGTSTLASTEAGEFESRLDNIFSEETRRERKTMITQDYRPKYKELFRDAFGLLKEMKQQTTPVNRPRSRPTTRTPRPTDRVPVTSSLTKSSTPTRHKASSPLANEEMSNSTSKK